MSKSKSRRAKVQPEAAPESAPERCPICPHPAHDDVAKARQCPVCICVAQDVAR